VHHDHDILSAAAADAEAKIRTAAPLREGDLLHRFLSAEWHDGRCRDLDDWLDDVRTLIAAVRASHLADAEALDQVADAFEEAGRFVGDLRALALAADTRAS
jgi:gamma-glutamyl:cysteine ligase YbdK (ATP-grasp superfamily)